MKAIIIVVLGSFFVLSLLVAVPTLQMRFERTSRALSAKYFNLLGSYGFSTGFK